MTAGMIMLERLSRYPFIRVLSRFTTWMIIGLLFIDSLQVAVEWWNGQSPIKGWHDVVWLLLLPLLILVFFRCYSIFRPGIQGVAFQGPAPSKKNPT